MKIALLMMLPFSMSAFAMCRVSNETGYSFTIESGNVSNQRVGGHVTTSISPGKVIGKSDEGKTVAGFCKDGDEMVVKEEKGVCILMPK